MFVASETIEYGKDLLCVLLQKELKVRYKSSWLGYAWSIGNPLAFALLYILAFGVFMRVQVPGVPYALFLIAGLFPWQWVANSINASPTIFLNNATLLKKVRFPRQILVAVTVLNDALHFTLAVPAITIFLFIYGLKPSWIWLVGIPIIAIAQFLTVYGIALALASTNLFFRDLERLTVLGVTFLFFLTPIVYSATMVPMQYRAILELNPIAPLILSWQQLFLSGSLDLELIVKSYISAGFFWGIGGLIYRRLCWRFAEVV